MSRIARLPLMPAEFYHLHSYREDPVLVHDPRQYDPDPKASAAIKREIEKRRMASSSQIPTIELTPDIVPRTSAFRRKCPEAIPHDFVVIDFSGTNCMRVVSAAWKDAIESLEPDVHKFFPHELRFNDTVVTSYFVVASVAEIKGGPHHFSAEWIDDQFNRLVGYRLSDRGSNQPVTIDRALVAGRHFLKSGDAHFVSRALAEKLHPLLPLGDVLIPIGFTGEPQQPSFTLPESDFSERSSERLEPELQRALELVADKYHPLSRDHLQAREKAQALVKRHARNATLPKLFSMMAVTIRFLGGLNENQGFGTCLEACRLRPEHDVLPHAQAWARDSDPVKRAAAAYILWRYSFVEEVVHSSETTDTLLALLDDQDPRVVETLIGVLAWTGLPVYAKALRDRRALFERHPDEHVRYIFKALVTDQDSPPEDGEEDEEQEDEGGDKANVPHSAAGELEVAALLVSLHEKTRKGNHDAAERITEQISDREEREVAAAASAWARDPEFEKRLIAARVLERQLWRWGTEWPLPETLDVIRALVADGEEEVVLAALKSFGELTHHGPYQPHQIAPVQLCENHSDARVRRAFAALFLKPGSATDDATLVRMARDRSRDVRADVVMRLSQRIKTGAATNENVREALAAMLADTDGFVRISAIEGLTKIDDPRARDAIVAELERPVDVLQPFLRSLLYSAKARPDARYLPGLRRLKGRVENRNLDAAIRACTIRSWLPWGR